ncbi:hypothetical protein DFH29DRAFT_883985 [Suillus ampliporus]|nr:hypothetical protein DFH29DRAFT_883985 [Suillus ampliporus]
MSASSKGINAMPGPNSSKAPTFNGETSELLEFFELFEDLAASCSLSNADKCKMIVCYVDLPTKHFWVTLPGYESKDFGALQTSILAQYPGTEKGLWYMIRDLERIVLNHADSDISTETKLLQYYRQFRPVAVWLVTNKKISAHERNRYFWQGLPQLARRDINRWLELKDPAYLRNEATNFEKVLEAGRFVLSDDAFDADLNDPITSRLKSIRDSRPVSSKPKPSRQNWDSDDEEERKSTPCEVQTKRVAFSPQAPVAPPPARSAIDEVEDLARQMHGLDIGDIAYSGCYTRLVCLAPAAAQAWAPPRSWQLAQSPPGYAPLPPLPGRNSNTQGDMCFFCGGSHMIRTCSIAGDYLRAGRVIRENQYFLFPDSSCIRRYAGATIKQAVDERYGSTLASTPATGANATPIDTTRHNAPPPTSPAPTSTSATITEAYFLQCTPVVENHAVVVTIEEEEDQDCKVHVNAITRSKAKAAESAPQDTPTPKLTRTIEGPPKPQDPDSKKQPAFTYESKAAAPDAAGRIYGSILDMVVPHLTVADLLAISPDLRKEAVEHCRTQRVPTSSALLSVDALTATAQPNTSSPSRTCDTVAGITSHAQWRAFRTRTARRGIRDSGCLEMLEIEVEGIKTWAHSEDPGNVLCLKHQNMPPHPAPGLSHQAVSLSRASTWT